MRRWWVSVRLGRWLIAWWPFDPRRSKMDGDCLPNIFGFIVGCSDAEGSPEPSAEFLGERVDELEFELARVKAERDEISDSLAKMDEKWRHAYNLLREYQDVAGIPW